MNENYYNLIREVTEKYDYAYKDMVKYNKNDDFIDKAYKDFNHKLNIKDSHYYGDVKIKSYVAMGIPLRREVLFTPVIIDCFAIIILDKKESIPHNHFCNYEAKLNIFDNRHKTLKKLFRTIADSKNEPEEVFKDEVKKGVFNVAYPYIGDSRVIIHNYSLLGKRIYRIKLRQWCYCFERDNNYDDYERSRYTARRLSIHVPDIEDITDRCLKTADAVVDQIKKLTKEVN